MKSAARTKHPVSPWTHMNKRPVILVHRNVSPSLSATVDGVPAGLDMALVQTGAGNKSHISIVTRGNVVVESDKYHHKAARPPIRLQLACVDPHEVGFSTVIGYF